MADRAHVLNRRRSPLAGLADEMAAGSGEQVALRELPFLAQVGLRAVPDTPGHAALAAAVGGLPGGVGEVVQAGSGRWVLWLGPDEFLVVAPDELDDGPDPVQLTAELGEALGEHPGQVVDLSANRTTLELRGPRSQEVLDKSCRLDLDLVARPAGTAVVTLLGSVGVILWRVEPDTWRIMPRSSFAVHTAHWLLDGMREFTAR